MRVHELAAATQLTSKEILAIAKKHRVAGVKQSASANVEDKDVRKMMPYIEKYKADLKAQEAEELRKKEEERKKKEEERRRKDEERRKAAEEKRKAEEAERLKAEEEARAAARKKAEDDRKKREEDERKKREEAAFRKAEEERLRGLGLRVPQRMAEGGFRPAPQAVPPADAKTAATAPPAAPAPQRPKEGFRPRPPQEGGFRPRPPQEGGFRPRPPQEGGFRPRPPQEGGFRPRPPQEGGFRPRPQDGTQRPAGPRPEYPRRDQTGRPQGGPGGFNRPGGPPQRPTGGPGRRDESHGTKPVKLTEDLLPTIGVMRDTKHARAHDKDKKGPKAGEKRSKVAPRKIFELDEDMTLTARPRTGRGSGPATRPGGMRGGGFGARKGGGRGGPRQSGAPSYQRQEAPTDGQPRKVSVEGQLTVAQFAEHIGVSGTDVLKKLLLLGEMVNLNQNISHEMMEVIAPDFNVEIEIVREKSDADDIEAYLPQSSPEKMKRRPPVVTIMGHVDHGKTSLLDYLRKSKVMEGEFGGITQHIGAYHVETSKGDIVFLDTPGHEAFTSMRARGASVTDLVILVVAANDGFKPQTIEAIHHSQAAKVPIVVAVNKVDLHGADPAKVRQEALQHNLIPEELGGETIFVDISAKFGQNVDQLLEMVALQAEILDLKADPDTNAVGTIVESHVDPTRGAVATVLVQRGTLRAGDEFVAGDISGRVRAMVDDHGKTIEEAGPSIPVEILGLTGSPPAGEMFLVVPNEQIARQIAGKREIRRRNAGLNPTQQHMTLEGLHELISEGKTKELNLILKADVQGSIEAISQSLMKLPASQVKIKILHSGVGGVNESDVNLAVASDAVIIGFNVRPEVNAQEAADRDGISIKLYRIIYDLIEDVRNAMVGMLDAKFNEKILGHAEVRQLYRASKIGTIAGCYVRDGEIIRDSKVRIVRDNIVVYDGKIGGLRRIKDDVKKVATGLECGILIENYNDLKEGDIIEAYMMEEVAAVLESK